MLTGAPVQFTEECRVTTGRTLTFFGTAGKLIVDGNDATRTVTKGGGTLRAAVPHLARPADGHAPHRRA